MCENCERIYVVVHPDSAKRIHLTRLSNADRAYRLTCDCKAQRLFDKSGPQAYRVSEYSCLRGYADRGEYDALPKRTAEVAGREQS